MNMPEPHKQPGVNSAVGKMVDTFGQMSFVQKTGKIYLDGEEEEEDDEDAKKKKKK